MAKYFDIDKILVGTKVRKVAKIRNRYNHVAHLTQDTTWENDKNTSKHTNKSQDDQEVSPFPASDQKVTKHDKRKPYIT